MFLHKEAGYVSIATTHLINSQEGGGGHMIQIKAEIHLL